MSMRSARQLQGGKPIPWRVTQFEPHPDERSFYGTTSENELLGSGMVRGERASLVEHSATGGQGRPC